MFAIAPPALLIRVPGSTEEDNVNGGSPVANLGKGVVSAILLLSSLFFVLTHILETLLRVWSSEQFC